MNCLLQGAAWKGDETISYERWFWYSCFCSRIVIFTCNSMKSLLPQRFWGHQIPRNLRGKKSQGILFVIFSCQRVLFSVGWILCYSWYLLWPLFTCLALPRVWGSTLSRRAGDNDHIWKDANQPKQQIARCAPSEANHFTECFRGGHRGGRNITSFCGSPDPFSCMKDESFPP